MKARRSNSKRAGLQVSSIGHGTHPVVKVVNFIQTDVVNGHTIGSSRVTAVAAAAPHLRFTGVLKAVMSKGQPGDEVRGNRLLAAMEAASLARIAPHLEPVVLKLGDVVCEAGGLLKHAYFPQGAVLSLLTVLENGSAVETANIGREGAFGLFAAMYSRVSFNRCLVQFEGGMVRCPIEPLQSEFRHSEHVRDLFVSYSETLLSQVQQTVACNAMHTTEERICRWLLMMHDRAEGEALPYTHEFLSHMLGANRKSVTLAAQSLQTAGLISYQRGKIRVVDRAGLEQASCECYAIVKERFDAFLMPPSTAVQGDTTGRRTR
jgi:CRP-like cAMP-binding protein